jgi:hypothetical protein
MADDPCVTDADKYAVLFENDRVRVLEYQDVPGARTLPHDHPDSVMVTLSSFQRRLHLAEVQRDVQLISGSAHWLPAQRHAGENIGETATHTIFVELKDPPGAVRAAEGGAALGPRTD